MRIVGLLFIALLLGACERLQDRYFPRPEPKLEDFEPIVERDTRPGFVVLDTSTVIVVMDDGAQCLGPARSRATFGSGWTGTLTECPYPYSYQVQLNAGAVSNQIQLQEVLGSSGVIDENAPVFRPIAVVLVTDSIGRTYRFESAEGF